MSKKIGPDDIDEFTKAYIEAALWSSTDDDGEPLDANYVPANIDQKTLKKMIDDCAKFQRENADDLAKYNGPSKYTAEEIGGHDFWLTRERHGSGFWDDKKRWPDGAADRLTEAAHRFGEFGLYVGDDGYIYGERS